MPTLRIFCKDAEGTAISGCPVTVTAQGESASDAVYANGGTARVQPVTKHSDATGLVSFTLEANENLIPSDSIYRMVVAPPGRHKAKVAYFNVATSPSTQDIEDRLLDPPGSPESSALAAHILSLANHADVDTTGLATGNVLMWNGTDWAPASTHATDLEVASAVLVETNARIADVDAEETARIAADTAEATARANADTTLTNDLATLDSAVVKIAGAQTITGQKTYDAKPLINVLIEDIDLNDRYANLQTGTNISATLLSLLNTNETIRRARFTKPGDYLISSNVITRGNLILEAVPGVRLVVDDDSVFGIKFSHATDRLSNFVVRGFTIYDPDPAGHVGAEESHGIVPNKCDHFIIENNVIQAAGDEGIDVQHCSNGTVRGNRIIGVPSVSTSSGGGISVNSSGSITVENNYFSDPDNAGPAVKIEVAGAPVVSLNNNRVLNNRIVSWGDYGISVQPGANGDLEDILIAHNHITEAANCGINVSPTGGALVRRITIANNHVIGGGDLADSSPSHRGAINCASNVDAIITGNRVYDWGTSAGHHGIRARESVIADNRIDAVPDSGIYDESSTGGLVADNHISNTGTAASGTRKAIRLGTGTQSRGNRGHDNLDNTVLDDHLEDTSGAHAASAISVSATGTISSTDAQAALAELDSEKLAAGQAIGTVFASGKYHGPSGQATTTAASNGVVSYVPFFVPSNVTIDRIGIEVVTTAGSANSVVRLGIYNDTSGLPSTRVLDAGTVDTTSTGGKELTISQALTRGVYWLAAVGQGAPATEPVLRSITGFVPYIGGALAATVNARYAETAVTGALPATATPTNSTGSGYVVRLRAA